MTTSLATRRRHARRDWPRLTAQQQGTLNIPGVCLCVACGYPGVVGERDTERVLILHPARQFTYQGKGYAIPCRVPPDDPLAADTLARLAEAQEADDVAG